MQPGASADVYSLPPSIIKELAFIFAHNYMHRDGSNSPALSPSGAGPSLPKRAELALGSSWLEDAAGKPYTWQTDCGSLSATPPHGAAGNTCASAGLPKGQLSVLTGPGSGPCACHSLCSDTIPHPSCSWWPPA